MNTILITGNSSSFGFETARTFLTRDWNVIATTPTPRYEVLPACKRLHIVTIDVSDAASANNSVVPGPIPASETRRTFRFNCRSATGVFVARQSVIGGRNGVGC